MSEDLSTLNLVQLLNLLEPVPEPPPISLWPETTGWIWLGVALVAGLAFAIRLWIGRWRANAYRRAALQELAAAGNDASAIAEILRRTALSAYPRTDVAGLCGEDWLAFLDRTYGGTEFSNGHGQVIATLPYRATTDGEVDLAPLVIQWVRRHQRQAADR